MLLVCKYFGSVINSLIITKPISIYEKTNNNFMNCFTFRKTNSFIIKSQNSPFYADFSGIVSPKNTNRTPIFYLIQNWCTNKLV